MNSKSRLFTALTVALGLAVAATAGASTTTRVAPSRTTILPAQTAGSVADDVAELAGGDDQIEEAAEAWVNPSIAKAYGKGANTSAGKKAKSNPNVAGSFDALFFRQSRLANGGNQFSTEPPDQALAVGNGYVLESINNAVRVFDQAGNPASGVIDLNSFFGYAAAINRTTGARGPSTTDPVAYFDADTQRWFLVILTLDHVGTTSSLSGTNHLDIAVSTSGSPLGSWNIYQIPVHNNGNDGTPNHNCSLGFCLGDYPHIGADANGIYLTTNEFSTFGGGFYGAQVIAVPKAALAAGAATYAVNINTSDPQYLRDLGADGLAPGFTVWPAISPPGQYATQRSGTEYFLSSDAVFTSSGSDNQIRVWALTNTASLNTDTPDLQLSSTLAPVGVYGVPPRAAQKPGDYPVGQCLALASCRPFIASGGPSFKPLGQLNSNDSRMQQVAYSNGKLWGALDTAAIVDGVNRASIAWFIIQPQLNDIDFKAKTIKNGTLALSGTNLTYPAVGVTASGRGVIGFTVVGPNNYPSAGYAGIDALVGVGDVHIVAGGAGPQDGFTEYNTFSSRPRWGDYGAAAVDGASIWIASEYVNQTCTLATYMDGSTVSPLYVSPNFGSCSGTRASLGNYSTRITKIVP